MHTSARQNSWPFLGSFPTRASVVLHSHSPFIMCKVAEVILVKSPGVQKGGASQPMAALLPNPLSLSPPAQLRPHVCRGAGACHVCVGCAWPHMPKANTGKSDGATKTLTSHVI